MSKSKPESESTSATGGADATSTKGSKGAKTSKGAATTAPAKLSRTSMLKERFGRGDDPMAADRPKLLSVRFVLMVVLVLAGIAYIVMTWRALGANPPEDWGLYDILGEEKTRRWVWELDLWNYAIGFGAILLGLMVGAHPSTPLGRGNGVVVGMLACFGIGLLWICTFYLFADNITDIWVFGALGQWNLVVGIAFMAVGFSYATKWE